MGFWQEHEEHETAIAVAEARTALDAGQRVLRAPAPVEEALRDLGYRLSAQNDTSGVCSFCGIASDDVLVGVCGECG